MATRSNRSPATGSQSEPVADVDPSTSLRAALKPVIARARGLTSVATTSSACAARCRAWTPQPVPRSSARATGSRTVSWASEVEAGADRRARGRRRRGSAAPSSPGVRSLTTHQSCVVVGVRAAVEGGPHLAAEPAPCPSARAIDEPGEGALGVGPGGPAPAAGTAGPGSPAAMRPPYAGAPGWSRDAPEPREPTPRGGRRRRRRCSRRSRGPPVVAGREPGRARGSRARNVASVSASSASEIRAPLGCRRGRIVAPGPVRPDGHLVVPKMFQSGMPCVPGALLATGLVVSGAGAALVPRTEGGRRQRRPERSPGAAEGADHVRQEARTPVAQPDHVARAAAARGRHLEGARAGLLARRHPGCRAAAPRTPA